MPALKLLILAQRGLLVACNALFVLLSVTTVTLSIRKYPLARRLPPFFWFLTSSIWITSILQSLLDHGDNPRFLVPLQSLVVIWLIWVIAHAWQTLCRSKTIPHPLPPPPQAGEGNLSEIELCKRLRRLQSSISEIHR